MGENGWLVGVRVGAIPLADRGFVGAHFQQTRTGVIDDKAVYTITKVGQKSSSICQ